MLGARFLVLRQRQTLGRLRHVGNLSHDTNKLHKRRMDIPPIGLVTKEVESWRRDNEWELRIYYVDREMRKLAS